MENKKTFPDKQCRFCGGRMFISMQMCPVCGKRQVKMTAKEDRRDDIGELDCNIEPLTCSCGSVGWTDIRHDNGDVTLRCVCCGRVFSLPWVNR